MRQQSLANQLRWCIETKDFLLELIRYLYDIDSKYKAIINLLQEWGYLEEPLKKIEVMHNEFSENIRKLVVYLIQEHLEYIENQCSLIRETLQSYENKSEL